MIVRRAFDKWWSANGRHVKEETELTLKRERLGVDAVFRKQQDDSDTDVVEAEIDELLDIGDEE